VAKYLVFATHHEQADGIFGRVADQRDPSIAKKARQASRLELPSSVIGTVHKVPGRFPFYSIMPLVVPLSRI